MSEPLVTVFIPVFNCENYIRYCLESILNQTYKNLDILLVDDGSTDRSVEIIKNFSDPRIRLIENGENKGIPYTRNVGLREAKGKYMAIMDSDDLSDPHRIEKQVLYLEKNPEIDAVSSFYKMFNGKTEKKVSLPVTKPEEIQIYLLFFNPIANPASMVRLDAIRKYNMNYNPDYFVSQDYDFWARLSMVGKIAIIPEYLLKYRIGHENITKKSKRDHIDRRKKIINNIHKDLLDHYQIPIKGHHLDIFNEFFSYYYGSIRDLSVLTEVLHTLKEWNKLQGIFDRRLFLHILDQSIIIGLSNQQIKLNQKINLYNQFIEKKSWKDMVYILVKHYYYRIKGI